jgi:hypothetical protein
MQGDRTVGRQTQRCRLDGFGCEILTFAPDWPGTPGDYSLVAELDGRGQSVRSLRDFRVR